MLLLVVINSNLKLIFSGGAKAVKVPGHFEIRKWSSQVKSRGRRERFA